MILWSSKSTSESVSAKCRDMNRFLNDHRHDIVYNSPKVKDRRTGKCGLALPQNIIQTCKGRKQWRAELSEASWGEGQPSRVPLSLFCGTDKELYNQEKRTTGEWGDVRRAYVSRRRGDPRGKSHKERPEMTHFGQTAPIKGTKATPQVELWVGLLRSFQGPPLCCSHPPSLTGSQPDSA